MGKTSHSELSIAALLWRRGLGPLCPGRPGPAAGTGVCHRRHRLAAGAARAPKTIQLPPCHFISLPRGVQDAGHSNGCAARGRGNTPLGPWQTEWHSQHRAQTVTESLCLPALGFSRLSASSEMAPVVMVFFSLDTPGGAAAPGFVSMSSLLARFSCGTQGGTGQDPEYSHQLVQNARFLGSS